MLPSNASSRDSSFKLAPSTLPITTPERKSSDDLSDCAEVPAKCIRSETGVQDRMGRRLFELHEKLADVTKAPLSWFLPQVPEMTYMPYNFAWIPHEVPNSTSTPSSDKYSPSAVTSAEEVTAATAYSFEESVSTGSTQWSLPNKLPGLGTQVDACDYVLKKHAKKHEAESRLDLEKNDKGSRGPRMFPVRSV